MVRGKRKKKKKRHASQTATYKARSNIDGGKLIQAKGMRCVVCFSPSQIYCHASANGMFVAMWWLEAASAVGSF